MFDSPSMWVVYLAASAAAIAVAWAIASFLRLAGHAWRLALLLVPTFCAAVALAWLGLRPGIDLVGGGILVYELDAQAKPPGADFPRIERVVRERFGRASLREPLVRPYGERQVELVFPGADQEELRRAKALLAAQAQLELRIVASPDLDRELAGKASASFDPRETVIASDDGRPLARWVRVLPSADLDHRGKPGAIANEQDAIVRRPLPADRGSDDVPPLERRLVPIEPLQERRESKEILVLLDAQELGAGDFERVDTSRDEEGRLNILFEMTELGGMKLADLTGSHLPHDGRTRGLAIILDGEIISAPRIQSVISARGQITGKFSREETDRIASALRAGYLPFSETPVAEHLILPADPPFQVLPTWVLAAIAALVVALGLCLWLHRAAAAALAGALASFALLALGLLAALQFPVTLPTIVALMLLFGVGCLYSVGVAWFAARDRAAAAGGPSELRSLAVWAGVVGFVLGLLQFGSALPAYLVGTGLVQGASVGVAFGGVAWSLGLGLGAWILLSLAAELEDRSQAVEASVE